MRLIDADVLLTAIEADLQNFGKGTVPEYVFDWIRNEIEEQPTIDVNGNI